MNRTWSANAWPNGCKSIATPTAYCLPVGLKLWYHSYSLSRLFSAKVSTAARPVQVPCRAAPTPTAASAASAGGQPKARQQLTPRQRRLAQQRRKWEEVQRQQRQQQQQESPQRQPRKQEHVQEPASAVPDASGAQIRNFAGTGATPGATAAATASAAAAPARAQGDDLLAGARAMSRAAAPSSSNISSPILARRQPLATSPPSPLHQPLPSRQTAAVATKAPQWPSLFALGAALPPSLDLHTLPAPQLVSLARHWADEIVEWQRRTRPGSFTTPATHGSLPSSSSAAAAAVAAAAAAAAMDGRAPQMQRLPAAAGSRLALLTAAVDAQMTRGSLGHQELADLAWFVGHYDREHSLHVLHPVMGVPFSIVPQFMPDLRLEDFMPEMELRRDTIYLDDGSRAVEESRLTGWQSEIGATFRYSGKEMLPQPGGLSAHVLQVRNALWALTGVKYDSVLINYYADGKCGMRYHVDPLYDRWTPNSAVVSLGDTRTFIFREIQDHSVRWQYRVRNGDVVLMYSDCQDRLQHCVRVEKRAGDAGPRMSLVFKERLRGPAGDYLLP